MTIDRCPKPQVHVHKDLSATGPLLHAPRIGTLEWHNLHRRPDIEASGTAHRMPDRILFFRTDRCRGTNSWRGRESDSSVRTAGESENERVRVGAGPDRTLVRRRGYRSSRVREHHNDLRADGQSSRPRNDAYLAALQSGSRRRADFRGKDRRCLRESIVSRTE